MRTSYISTATFLNTPRSSMGRLQADLDKANIEAGSGRYADVGFELGYRTGETLDFRQELDDLEAQRQRNGLTKNRLDTTYQALNQVRLDGESFLAIVMPGKLTGDSGPTVEKAAASRLAALIAQMNSGSGGQYLFGGINTGVRPIASYEDATTSPAKQAFLDAFQAEFGFAPPGKQPDSGSITDTQMKTFLADGGRFANLFTDAQWAAKWSSASDVKIRSEIARNEMGDTSVSANAQPLRQLAMLYTLGSSIGLSSLSAVAQTVVYDKMRALAASATWGVTGLQSDVGTVQARVATVAQQMDAKKTILQEGVNALEAVDQAEAATRVNDLKKQLEIAYSLTSQVNKLSLMDYVR
ncbi:flagellar hook-associated family protein [Methylobacterium sp. J-070]|uniref:flagellar hook-associated family protein n=1 Tax=Methylobacterium sp. J-070 TaxID=2836650 RepID=UPI001FB9F11F|nr:flagellar hook-associated family protein [Methylobacterium sp. J-070]MCJ2048332.1 flagellar hook-associated family protein [Methylobacterium sp. J-070]